MITIILYSAIRLLSSIGAIALLNFTVPGEESKIVVDIYVTQTFVGAFASYGLQFDAYHAGIGKSGSSLIPRLNLGSYYLVTMTALIATLGIEVFSQNLLNFKTIEAAPIFLGALIFAIANIIGNYNIGTGNKGVGTLAFILPNIPILSISILWITGNTNFLLNYLVVCGLIILVCFFVLIQNINQGPAISIKKEGRTGKIFASFSQPLTIWMLMHNLSVSSGLSLAGYLLIQRVGDGASSLTMLIAQMKHIHRIISLIKDKRSCSIFLVQIEIIGILVACISVAYVLIFLSNNGIINLKVHATTFALEAIINISKILLAIVSLLLMRFNAKKSTIFEFSTVIIVSLLIIVAGNELADRQLAIIIGYLILVIYGYRLLNIDKTLEKI